MRTSEFPGRSDSSRVAAQPWWPAWKSKEWRLGLIPGRWDDGKGGNEQVPHVAGLSLLDVSGPGLEQLGRARGLQHREQASCGMMHDH